MPSCQRGDIIRRLAYLLTFIVLGISLLQAPLQSAGWIWDTGNALGFVGFAGLLYLFLDVGRGARQRVHQQLSYAVALAVAGHVLWMWLPDETLWHYMTWDAPHYMLAGWLSLMTLTGMIIIALPGRRRFWHMSYQQFQNWHYWLSLGVICTSLWHMAGSGFYVSAVETMLYILLIVAVLALHRRKQTAAPSIGGAAILVPAGVAAFVLLKLVST